MYIEQVSHKIPDKINPIELWFGEFDIDVLKTDADDLDVEKKYKLVDVSCGFDIETTTITEYKNNKISKANGYLYIWQFSLNNYVIYGRKADDFITFLKKLAELYELNKKRKIRIWIANLGFEFQFIRKYLHVTQIFAKKPREPLVVETDNYVFQDCLAFSGSNLDNLAKTYCSTKKLVGDLDYDIPRNSQTVLTRTELDYCKNDVVILSEFNKYVVDTYIKQGFKLPMTKTGLLRESVLERFIDDVVFEDDEGNITGIDTPKIDKFIAMFPDQDEYNTLMKYVFRGGYTHANILHVNDILTDVMGIDFTSSYPAVMLQSDKFPMDGFKDWNGDIQVLIDNHRPFYAHFIFYDLKNTTMHSIESISKVVGYTVSNEQTFVHENGITLDNGRILQAQKLEVWLTDVDYEVYKKFYTWDKTRSTCDNIRYSKYGRLPNYLLDTLKYYYRIKSKLKSEFGGSADDIPEYRIAKSMVNSAYGMCVQKYEVTKITYDDVDGWDKKTDGSYETRLGIDNRTLKYQGIPKVVLQPTWGIWITAQARKRLLDMVHLIGDDVIYNDTDSIYFLNYTKHKHLVDEWNNKIYELNKQLFGNEYDIFRTLGDFDLVNKHGYITKFKTLGAKRYVKTYPTKDGTLKTETTIAGLPKSALTDYCNQKGLDIYQVFSNDMCIDIAFSNKNAHKYNDNEHSDTVTDEQGHTEIMISLSSLGIYKTSFTMTIAEYYKWAMEHKEQIERVDFV